MSKAILAFSLVFVSAFAAQAKENSHSPNRKVAMVRQAPKQAPRQTVAMNSPQRKSMPAVKPASSTATIEIDEGD